VRAGGHQLEPPAGRRIDTDQENHGLATAGLEDRLVHEPIHVPARVRYVGEGPFAPLPQESVRAVLGPSVRAGVIPTLVDTDGSRFFTSPTTADPPPIRPRGRT